MVFCFRNYSDLLRGKIVLLIDKNFVAEGRNFPKKIKITRTIYSNSEISQNSFWNIIFY